MMDGAQLVRMFAAFGFVLALMFGIAWLVRRFRLDERLQGLGRARGTGSLVVLESLHLDPKRRVVVLGHERARYLVLLGEQNTVLATLPGGVGDAT